MEVKKSIAEDGRIRISIRGIANYKYENCKLTEFCHQNGLKYINFYGRIYYFCKKNEIDELKLPDLIKNTLYKMLKNEKYAGIVRYNDEVFTNIYPRIIPEDIFLIVRKKVEENHYGKHNPDVVYLLKNKLKCKKLYILILVLINPWTINIVSNLFLYYLLDTSLSDLFIKIFNPENAQVICF